MAKIRTEYSIFNEHLSYKYRTVQDSLPLYSVLIIIQFMCPTQAKEKKNAYYTVDCNAPSNNTAKYGQHGMTTLHHRCQ